MNRLVIIIILLIASFCLHAQTNTPPIPPTPTNTVIHCPPFNLVQRTNIELSWEPYTNEVIHILCTTDMVTWTEYTNFPVWRTNAVVPISGPLMFFKFGSNTYLP